jgi:hypothetical protein
LVDADLVGAARSDGLTGVADVDGGWEAAVGVVGVGQRNVSELRVALARLRAEIALAEGTRARLFRPIRGPRRIRLPERMPWDATVRILLSRDGRTGYARELNQVGIDDLVFCHPMRDFSRRNGQLNKPVAFYSRTVGDLVACESQHERRFALLADWNERVAHIAAQPFTIDFPPGHEFGSHTPDFALITSTGGIIIVDVKWHAHAARDDHMRRHAAVHDVLVQAGMQHTVWSDAPHTVTENLANFAAARVPEPLLCDLAPKLVAAHRPGMTVGTLIDTAAEAHVVPRSTLLVVVRRLLWDHQFTTDLLRPFALDLELTRR